MQNAFWKTLSWIRSDKKFRDGVRYRRIEPNKAMTSQTIIKEDVCKYAFRACILCTLVLTVFMIYIDTRIYLNYWKVFGCLFISPILLNQCNDFKAKKIEMITHEHDSVIGSIMDLCEIALDMSRTLNNTNTV